MNLKHLVDNIMNSYFDTSAKDFEECVRQTLLLAEMQSYNKGLEHGKNLAQGAINTYSRALEESNNAVEELTEALDDLKRRTMFSGT